MPEAGAQIRLNALATKFFQPLEDLRGDKRYFISNKVFTSLDCLVLGYLSLMLIPELPQPWLANAMRNKFPTLCNWTEALGASVFGPETTLEDAFPRSLGDSVEDVREKRTRAQKILPWKAPDNGGVFGVSGTFLSSVADSTPVFGQWRRNLRMRQYGGKTPAEEQSSSWQTITTISGFVAATGAAIGYALHTGLISMPAAEEKMEEPSGLESFGDAGAALGLYADHLNAPVRDEVIHNNITTEGVPIAEVNVEVDAR
jgi:sorting and assembly machinery component 37